MIVSPYRAALRAGTDRLRTIPLAQSMSALQDRLRFQGLQPSVSQLDALASVLFEENRLAYIARLQLETGKLGLHLSGDLDPYTLAALQHRASLSARQIAASYRDRALRAQGRGEDLSVWVEQYAAARAPVIARYEGDRTSGSAFSDYYRQNSIVGTAHVEPTDYAIDDMCPEYIDLGEVGLAIALQYTLPAHNECPHDWVSSLAPTTDWTASTGPSNLDPGLLAGITWAGGLTVTSGGTHDTQ